MENTFYISTDKSQLDVDVIFNYLTNQSYWAKGRSREAVKKQSSTHYALACMMMKTSRLVLQGL